ncbi:hypothetical protein MKZ38_005743 [Zalerion maritima]|uniref:Alcohol acetyltransferase n=1 Tax=Zalerion maritima TaxID=339359 RepID=A0AAD5RKY3_9PEZI|nr:hypothetical protein MKZ38_005743 [Zalerion maritima]
MEPFVSSTVAAGDAAGIRLRDLRDYERFRVVQHDLGFHLTVSVVGLYTVRSIPQEDIMPVLLLAAKAVAEEHPNLCLQVRGGQDDTLHFVHLPRFDLGKMVVFHHSSPVRYNRHNSRLERVEKMLSEESNTPFQDSNLPLWRMTVLDLGPKDDGLHATELAVNLTFHHAIADGKSGQAFHDSLLRALQQTRVTSGKPNQLGTIVETPSRDPAPALEDTLAYKTSWMSSVRRWTLPCLQPEKLGPAISDHRWTGSSFVPPSGGNDQTGIRLMFISKAIIDILRRRCRQESTSVTALLQVAVATVLLNLFDKADSVRCATALSVRRFLPASAGIDETQMGLWIDAYYTDCSRSQAFREAPHGPRPNHTVSWDECRRHKKIIKYHLKKGDCDLSFRSFHGEPDYATKLRDRAGRQRSNSYSVTNIGVFEASAQTQSVLKALVGTRKWELTKMVLSQSAHTNGSAVQFCGASTVEGGLAISLNWQRGVVSDSKIDSMRDDLQSLLECLAQES